jgi:hypothetical protein
MGGREEKISMRKIFPVFILLFLLACNLSSAPPTALQTATIAPNINGIVQRMYDPGEWKLIYDQDMVWQSEISPTQKVWIVLDKGEIGFFDGNNWVLYSGQDYGFPDKPNDMAIASDCTVWIS